MKKIKIGQGEFSKLEEAVFKEIATPTFEQKPFIEVYKLLALDYCGLLKTSKKIEKKLLELYRTIKEFEALPKEPLPEKSIKYYS